MSIQAISYCAKNPSQKLAPEQAKNIRKQRKLLLRSSTCSSQDFHDHHPSDLNFFEADQQPHQKFISFDWPTLTTLMALMTKNMIKMMRNYSGLFFAFLLPAVEVFFFCIALGRDPTQLPLAIVNHEQNLTGTPVQ